MKYHFTVPNDKRVRVIVSTDAACEADDPFAIAHALLSPKMDVRAIIAEHFMEEGSMERSHSAACKLTGLMGSSVPVLNGQHWPKIFDEISEGAAFIVEEARREHRHPLYVLCMGAVTTVAAALAAAPDIAGRFVLVTIGGHSYGSDAFDWREFNWGNDPDAVNAILHTKVEVWQVPSSVYSAMNVGLAELQRKVEPCGAVGEYLLRQMDEYNHTESAGWTNGESWSLGDNPSVAVVLNDMCGKWRMQEARLVNADTTYGEQVTERLIRVYTSVDSRYVLEDLFSKLAIHFG